MTNVNVGESLRLTTTVVLLLVGWVVFRVNPWGLAPTAGVSESERSAHEPAQVSNADGNDAQVTNPAPPLHGVVTRESVTPAPEPRIPGVPVKEAPWSVSGPDAHTEALRWLKNLAGRRILFLGDSMVRKVRS